VGEKAKRWEVKKIKMFVAEESKAIGSGKRKKGKVVPVLK
jgi:hypothetical protein